MNIYGITQKERGNVLNIKLPFIDYFPAIILHFFLGFSIATFDYRRVVEMESNMEI